MATRPDSSARVIDHAFAAEELDLALEAAGAMTTHLDRACGRLDELERGGLVLARAELAATLRRIRAIRAFAGAPR